MEWEAIMSVIDELWLLLCVVDGAEQIAKLSDHKVTSRNASSALEVKGKRWEGRSVCLIYHSRLCTLWIKAS